MLVTRSKGSASRRRRARSRGRTAEDRGRQRGQVLRLRTNVEDWVEIDADHPPAIRSKAADGPNPMCWSATGSEALAEAGAVLRSRRLGRGAGGGWRRDVRRGVGRRVLPDGAGERSGGMGGGVRADSGHATAMGGQPKFRTMILRRAASSPSSIAVRSKALSSRRSFCL